MSETDTCREELARYCQGLGLDIGFGGSAIVPDAITFDLAQPYTQVGNDRQVMQGNCFNLNMFCNDSLDYIFSSHLIEDFYYPEQVNLIKEWRRVLKPGGNLVINCPDQQKFLAHCARTGQPLNLAHKESDFSLLNFREKVLIHTGNWETLYEKPEHGPYSWLFVARKV